MVLWGYCHGWLVHYRHMPRFIIGYISIYINYHGCFLRDRRVDIFAGVKNFCVTDKTEETDIDLFIAKAKAWTQVVVARQYFSSRGSTVAIPGTR